METNDASQMNPASLRTTVSGSRGGALYVHSPFCEAKCHYCDFVSYAEKNFDSAAKQNIYKSILDELALHDVKRKSLESIYFGGGTPSLAPVEFVAAILDGSSAAEVTLEANPSSVTREKARSWTGAGVNRLSLGIQAWDDTRLAWLGRVHSKMDALDALEAASASGVSSISVDYMVGVPGQNLSQIELELAWLLRRFPAIDHVSAYLLTLKNSNRFHDELPGEQDQLAHLRAVRSVLTDLGFEHYEISNFARSGRRSRHNENYWLGGAYLGIGPSSHSFFPGTNERTRNHASLEKYSSEVSQGRRPIAWTEKLTQEQRRMEYIMLRLRRCDGIDLDEFSRLFGENLLETKGREIEEFHAQGLCEVGATLRLRSDGFFLSDHIFGKLV